MLRYISIFLFFLNIEEDFNNRLCKNRVEIESKSRSMFFFCSLANHFYFSRLVGKKRKKKKKERQRGKKYKV